MRRRSIRKASKPTSRICARWPSLDRTPRRRNEKGAAGRRPFSLPLAAPAVHAFTLEMRIFNFSAGPAVLPEPVLRKAAAEMLDWHGSGMSVMEMSHRGKEFISIADKAEADLRVL